MKTVTIEATYVEGNRRSTAPEGYTLHSVTTETPVAGYTKVWHNYVSAAPTSSPTDAEIDRRVALINEACAAPDRGHGAWLPVELGLAWGGGHFYEWLPKDGWTAIGDGTYPDPLAAADEAEAWFRHVVAGLPGLNNQQAG